MLVKDKKTGRSYIVHADWNAEYKDRLRLDILTPLGAHVASLVMNKDEVSYILLKEKKFFKGKAKPQVLEPLISAPLDPHLFYNLLFDFPIADSRWECEKDEQNFLKLCKNSSENLEITWMDRLMDRKTVKIEHPRASLQINFLEYSNKLQDKKNLFVLKAPKSFRLIMSQ